jgi:hypothetical protein
MTTTSHSGRAQIDSYRNKKIISTGNLSNEELELPLKRSVEMRIARLVSPVFALLLVAALVSTTLVQAQIGTLQINRAVYGKEGLGKDVTQRLQKMIQNNTLDIKVTNITMGGDPNKGADKTLKVDYTFRGKRLQVVVKEGDRLKLP